VIRHELPVFGKQHDGIRVQQRRHGHDCKVRLNDEVILLAARIGCTAA
jgi:hypothetical protein